MSGFGSFSGFGQDSNTAQQQQPATGFAAFGTGTTGFGTTPSSGFGTNNNTTGTGIFGSVTPGNTFGTAANNAFGAPKPSAFGTTPATGTGIFGTNTTNTSNTTNAFGSGFSTTATPAFGTANTGNGIFGASNSSPFGSTTTSSAFGAPASSALSQAGAGECQGTGSVPFQAFVEKEPNSSTNQQNSFQNIAFQLPYQKFSMEELRLADYNQGRRFGNGSNQVGAFGQTNFGAFGTGSTGFGTTNNNNATTTGRNMFGVPANNTTPFGTAQTSTSAFGSNVGTTGNSIFGTTPATGIFGSQTSTSQPSGIFGSTNNANNTNAFGSNLSGGSVFGQTNASKPAFGFGTTQSASIGNAFGTPSTSTGFGAPAGGGAFGSSLTSNSTSAFGAQPTQNNAFSAFGGTTQQPTPTVFGSTANKPAMGAFGAPAANTSTPGLFGSQPSNNNSAFGLNNNQNNAGIFGSKPAQSTDNIFGSTNTANTGNLFNGFSNANPTQAQSSGLFGATNNNNNNNQSKPSIFGTSTQPSTGLFGNSMNQPQNSLFGTSNNNSLQQPQSNSLFGSSLSLNNPAQNSQVPQSLTANISDNGAFGSQSLFSNIAQTQVNNPGPIATPLSGNRSPAASRNAALPLYKLNSVAAPRFTTPQRRGFGFSYSAIGSPASASSTVSTPGNFSNSNLLGPNSFSRTLNKSVSTSSLRRSFNAEDSILAPGAFSASPSARNFGSAGSVKKLTISRNVRSDLFTPISAHPPISASSNSTGTLKKRVSFDSNVNGNSIGAPSPLRQVNLVAPTSLATSAALTALPALTAPSRSLNSNATEAPKASDASATPASSDLGYLRPRPSVETNQSSEIITTPEVDQITNSNSQLAIVREEDDVEHIPQEAAADPQPGDYWMSPNKAEIENMNRVQRQKVIGLTVGRHGVGSVRFDCPVDLITTNIDEIMGGIVKIEVRQVTVYPDNYQKPAMGKGLNVPSTITLDNSWPRKKDRKTPLTEQSGLRLQKHIEKLKKVQDTEFVSYEKTTGTWTFKVPHFTTYGLPEEDDDDLVEPESKDNVQKNPRLFQQALSPENSTRGFASSSTINSTLSGPEDTFEFKKSSKFVPGAFDDDMVDNFTEPEKGYFLDDRSMISTSETGNEESSEPDEYLDNEYSVEIFDQVMSRSHHEIGSDPELVESQYAENDMDTLSNTPKVHESSRQRDLMNRFGSSFKQQFSPGDDWTAALQTTVSPRKQDRAYLKSRAKSEEENLQLDARSSSTPSPDGDDFDTNNFSTSIDLINSMLGQSKSPIKSTRKGKGFKWPFEKYKSNDDIDLSNMDEAERLFHYSMKPSWGHDGTLIYAAPSPETPFRKSSNYREKNNLLVVQDRCIVSEHRDVRFAKFSNENSADLLKNHKKITKIDDSGEVPRAYPSDHILFSDFFDGINGRDPATVHEKLVWQLASILWDPLDVPQELQNVLHIDSRLRKNNLSKFWKSLVYESVTKQVALAKSHEEKAIAYLSGHRIDDACSSLATANNPRLSTLVALIGSKDSIREEMREQINSWRKSKMLSEFTEPIRALYEILAGNVCVCEGVKGPPEDRVESFTISKRFGLDWRQAFGLRLWYSTPTGEFIESAVQSFAEDLAQTREKSWPSPWYIEQKVPALWQDPSIAERVDLLWGLMKLYTFEDADLEDILRPENSQLSPMDVRLSWQLSQVIISSGSIQFTGDKKNKADKTTLSFASQLTNEGSWLDAVFVLLHLSSSHARAKAIQDHLGHHAGKIGSRDSQAFSFLTENLKIPASWIWEAKALYLRSVDKDPIAEVECLISAASFSEAHRTFSREVAPSTIIKLDYDTLQKLLDGFSGKDAVIGDWFLGGQIYKDFLELVQCQERQEFVDEIVLQRLLCGLPSVGDDLRHLTFIEGVAIETMSAVVAQAALALGNQEKKKYLASVLSLPLTEDKHLKYSVELGLENFRHLMARAR